MYIISFDHGICEQIFSNATGFFIERVNVITGWRHRHGHSVLDSDYDHSPNEHATSHVFQNKTLVAQTLSILM